MAKDKKKKDKKTGNGKGKSASLSKASRKATKSLRSISQNPLVADVVAATLVAMASALKDSKKARQLASEAGDELTSLSKGAGRKGNEMWDLALEIGRRTLHTISGENEAGGKAGKSR